MCHGWQISYHKSSTVVVCFSTYTLSLNPFHAGVYLVISVSFKLLSMLLVISIV